MKGLFIPEITAEEFRNGCLESIEELMAEGEIYDIEYSPWIPVSKRLPEESGMYLATEKVFRIDDCRHKKEYILKTDYVEWYADTKRFARASYFEVIAWMPLPEPYEQQESEE